MNQEELEQRKAEIYLSTRGWMETSEGEVSTWTNPGFYGRLSLSAAIEKQVVADVASLVFVLENVEKTPFADARKVLMGSLLIGLLEVSKEIFQDALEDKALQTKLGSMLAEDKEAQQALNTLRSGLKSWLAGG